MEYKRYIKRNINFIDPDGDDVFMIVFDVSCLNENEIKIELQEGHKLKVSLQHGFRETGDISFSRDCTYVYTLPENVQPTNLVAHWFEDDFLVIKEKRRATEITFKSDEGDSDENELNNDEIQNVSAPTDTEATPNGTSTRNLKQAWQSSNVSRQNNEMIQDELSPISSSKNKEIIQDKRFQISSSKYKEMTSDRQSPISSSNNEELVQDNKSSISSSNSKEMVKPEMQSKMAIEDRIPKSKSQISAIKNEEVDMQEMKSKIASSENKHISSSDNEELATKDRNSAKTSMKRCKKLVQEYKIQEDKSVDCTSKVQTNSYLIPIKTRNLSTGILSNDDLKAAMVDIGKRMKYVNEFLEMHGS